MSRETEWQDAFALANLPTLLPLLVQMTGNTTWQRDPDDRRSKGRVTVIDPLRLVAEPVKSGETA